MTGCYIFIRRIFISAFYVCSIIFGPPADKRDLTTFCNILSYTHLKSAKNRNFYSHSNMIHLCVMHRSISHLFYLQLF